MRMHLQSDDVTLEFSSAGVAAWQAVTDGVEFGYDGEGKIVAIEVLSPPWVHLADMGTDVDRSTGAVIRYDAAVDALAIDVANSSYKDSVEVLPGVIVDFNDRGDIVGLEFLDVRDHFSKDAQAEIAKYANGSLHTFESRKQMSA